MSTQKRKKHNRNGGSNNKVNNYNYYYDNMDDKNIVNINLLNGFTESKRKKYLIKLKEKYDKKFILKNLKIDELKYKQVLLKSNLPCFDGVNKFEKEVNFLLRNNIKSERIKYLLKKLYGEYNIESISKSFNITNEEFIKYLNLFNIKENILNLNLANKDNLSLINYYSEVFKNDKLIFKDSIIPPKKEEIIIVNNNLEEKNNNEFEELKNFKISFLKFINMDFNKRKDLLLKLNKYFKDEIRIEKILGIPNKYLYRNLLSRHDIFIQPFQGNKKIIKFINENNSSFSSIQNKIINMLNYKGGINYFKDKFSIKATNSEVEKTIYNYFGINYNITYDCFYSESFCDFRIKTFYKIKECLDNKNDLSLNLTKEEINDIYNIIEKHEKDLELDNENNNIEEDNNNDNEIIINENNNVNNIIANDNKIINENFAIENLSLNFNIKNKQDIERSLEIIKYQFSLLLNNNTNYSINLTFKNNN